MHMTPAEQLENRVGGVFGQNGDLGHRVNAVLLWQLAVWRLWFDESDAGGDGKKGRVIDPHQIVRCAHPDLLTEFGETGILELSYGLLEAIGEDALGKRRALAWRTRHGEMVLSVQALDPMYLVRLLFGKMGLEHTLRHHVFASIRRRYRCILSSETARVFHTLANVVNRQLLNPAQSTERQGEKHRISWMLVTEFLPPLIEAASGLVDSAAERERLLHLFLGVARALSYIQVEEKRGYIVSRTHSFDAEYMLSSLFGLATNIHGFDELFGGGLLLVEESSFATRKPPLWRRPERISGRIILATGRYGTGKSLLALQVAVAVAEKGGVAWILALEQSSEECRYTLETMGLLPKNAAIEVAVGTREAMRLLRDPEAGGQDQRDGRVKSKGALIFLDAEKQSYEKFLTDLPKPMEWIQSYPLRLIVVDPINAINQGQKPDYGKLRIEMIKVFENIKDSGTNVWFNAEDPSRSSNTFFERNIADTVIHLSTGQIHGREQRYIEIQKSRLQREQRGLHPFEIASGVGIRIFPSSAAISDRLSARSAKIPVRKAGFGISSLDEVLGPEAIRDGDVVLLQGPPGCYKTQVGIRFLFGKAKHGKNTSGNPSTRNLLFVSGDAQIGMRQLIQQYRVEGNPVDVVPLPDGQVHPGQVLQAIELQLLRRQPGEPIVDRVMFGNVAHWDTNCPFLREDEMFGSVLLQMLRRYNVTAVLISSAPNAEASRLETVLFDNADSVIEFHNTDREGRSNVILRVLKTRTSQNKRGWFDLDVGQDAESIVVRSTPSLLRVSSDGKVSRIPIRLLLHAETDMQATYNREVQRSLKASVSRSVQIAEQRKFLVDRVLGLSPFSVLDELQLLQLDEHQVPSKETGDTELHLSEFPNKSGKAIELTAEWLDLLPRLRNRVRLNSGKIVAWPYLQNISFLASVKDIPEECMRSWRELARECERFEHEKPNELFFEFAKDSDENYNCLFLEILLSLACPPEKSTNCVLLDWIRKRETVEALELFWRLCRRAHGWPTARLRGAQTMQVEKKAKVWRHWYSTLNQMLAEMTPSERSNIRVGPLPGGVTTAGEWFLAVPAHSAAPELAIAMIQDLTSQNAESERVRQGVGLPTRISYYEFAGASGEINTPVSPYFSMPIGILRQLVADAFARSSIRCYTQFSSALTSHLLRMLEEGGDVNSAHVREIQHSLELRLAALSHTEACRTIRIDDPSKG